MCETQLFVQHPWKEMERSIYTQVGHVLYELVSEQKHLPSNLLPFQALKLARQLMAQENEGDEEDKPEST